MILAFKDGKAEPTAVIMLSDINSVSKDHDSKYSYLVCRKILQIIVLKDNREHSIKSESDTDIDAWYKAVSKHHQT